MFPEFTIEEVGLDQALEDMVPMPFAGNNQSSNTNNQSTDDVWDPLAGVLG
jgi:hypothetical protein